MTEKYNTFINAPKGTSDKQYHQQICLVVLYILRECILSHMYINKYITKSEAEDLNCNDSKSNIRVHSCGGRNETMTITSPLHMQQKYNSIHKEYSAERTTTLGCSV